MRLEPLELTVKREHIVQAIALYLQSLSTLPNAGDVFDIQFREMSGDKDWKLKVFFKPEEVEVLHF